MPRLVALADYNIAYLYYFRGQYGRAIDALKATRRRLREAGRRLPGRAVPARPRRDLPRAEPRARTRPRWRRRPWPAFRRLGIGYEAAKALGFLAIAHGQQGKVLRALELCAEARALFVQEQNSVWPALLDLYQALILFGAGRLFESRRRCVAALRGASGRRRWPARPSCAGCCWRAWRCAWATSTRPARECDEAAAGAVRPGPARAELPAPLRAGARSSRRRGSRRRRTSAYRARAAVPGDAAQQPARRGAEDRVHEEQARGLRGPGGALAPAGRRRRRAVAEAFAYVEQAKSRSLQELLLRAAIPSGAERRGKSELVRRVGELREELNWYYHRIEAEQMAPEERTAERLQRAARRGAGARGRAAARAARAARRRTAEPLELLAAARACRSATIRAGAARRRHARRVLPRRRRGCSRSWSPARRLEVVPVALVARVQHLAAAAAVPALLGAPGAGQRPPARAQSSLAATQAHLQELYEELLAPLRPRLDAAHLVFVPHDLLHYVPFHALHDGRRHLIDSFSVSYAPERDASTPCATPRATDGSGSSLVLGRARRRRRRSSRTRCASVAARLPDAGAVHRARRRRTQVLREKGRGTPLRPHRRPRVLPAGDNPMFSGIRLGGSYLTLYDLYNLKLPAELVTLSACVTGLNVIAAGDELLGPGARPVPRRRRLAAAHAVGGRRTRARRSS